MSHWRNDLADDMKTSLAASLTTWGWTRRPSQLLEQADKAICGCIVPGRFRFVPDESESDGNRCIDCDYLIGTYCQGIDDDERAQDLADALDDLEAAIWVLTAPGTFMDSNNLDSVQAIDCNPGDVAGLAVTTVTLRLYRTD